uniref:Uncharacterized protein n=1 Tax=Arundo donax TaxID=35708 RepID=A0A0A8YTJ2_ARUDO
MVPDGSMRVCLDLCGGGQIHEGTLGSTRRRLASCEGAWSVSSPVPK